jgi:hypothetical protein
MSPASVVVFVDRSASMQGFLDPKFPTRVTTDYRSVIDKVLVGLNPSGAHSFGSQLRAIDATIGTLSARGFYSDRDTRLEDVLAFINKDTSLAKAYVVVTDGRRGSPTLSLSQYSSLRTTARGWIQRGGSFVIAASMAPFTSVAGDPSGCRRDSESAEDQRCPLYAFALVPAGSQRWLTGVLATAFEDVFAWPSPRVAGSEQALISPPVQKNLQFERNWGRTPAGTPIVRSRGNAPTIQWATLATTIADSASPEGAGLLAAIRGQHIRTVIQTRRYAEGPRSPYQPVATAGLIQTNPANPLAVDLISRGQAANVQPTLYRVDRLPDGYPTWLNRYDASDAGDRLHTFGLSVLFESFRQEAHGLNPDSASILRLFVLAN